MSAPLAFDLEKKKNISRNLVTWNQIKRNFFLRFKIWPRHVDLVIREKMITDSVVQWQIDLLNKKHKFLLEEGNPIKPLVSLFDVIILLARNQ